jgi:hypothetical protein
MKKLILALTVTLVACSVPFTSVSEQDLCQIDPTTGECPVYLDAYSASADASTQWSWDNLNPDTVQNASCARTNNQILCQVSVVVAGHSAMVYCAVTTRRLPNGTYVVVTLNCGTH